MRLEGLTGWRWGVAGLLLGLSLGAGAGQPVAEAEKPCCSGEVYFSCICPGDKVCPADDGEYDFPFDSCSTPLAVTATNIDNIVGNLRLADPPCKDPKQCRRISVLDASSPPARKPQCRCREKTAVCQPAT